MKQLEQRVAALESQVAALQAAQANGVQPTGWRTTVGMFTGDEVMKQIDRAARKIREADRRRTRAGVTSNARAKK
ncbi:MAG: hypothetical protein L0Y72_10480 [Gemmataceae bacterium]|nr:hypothetical protein [Gemmataceae bacterium]MCI0739459.1 hypothetical protein [Gemmataceae bacterium]